MLCTDPAADPTQILGWFVLRWQLEVNFQEVRTHLGVETKRQWSDQAIARTTPILIGIFSWTTLAAHALQDHHPITQRTAAWYAKPSPTLVDAIALVRRHLLIAERCCLTEGRESGSCSTYAATWMGLMAVSRWSPCCSHQSMNRETAR